MTESRLQKCIVTVYCVLMMFVLGTSDALRGVFLPVFRDSFSLSQSQSSAIIMCSYIGMLLERRGMLLLCGSGLAFSILWPTIVLLIGRYYDPGLAGTATGFITGFATLFDVAFNTCFGKLIDWLGFGTAIQILPVSMLLLCLSFFLLRIRVPRSKEIL